MKKLLSLIAASACLSFTAAHAADKAPTAQQSKMATCNADDKAKTLKGDERKAFMKECLSAKGSETQQTKMKTCNADTKAKTLKGDERKAFMKECLSNKPA
ncbi:PsiF family protein [Pararhizobium sp.]|uniref:PsiF family protein n=1 Tax=Pararhizobium sp. TaxID=1977563 RepID=UPI002726F9DE|nr:PsiF family protein [Pararhizobium sp.]MDO9417381.1 PsiF family protein [Pararhizobium sp.]